jgi:hypothetical protein
MLSVPTSEKLPARSKLTRMSALYSASSVVQVRNCPAAAFGPKSRVRFAMSVISFVASAISR